MSNELLTILGAIITFLLAVNAWYFKGIVSSLQQVELKLEKVITEKDYMDRMLLNHDDDIKKLFEKLHSVDSATRQLMAWVEENHK